MKVNNPNNIEFPLIIENQEQFNKFCSKGELLGYSWHFKNLNSFKTLNSFIPQFPVKIVHLGYNKLGLTNNIN